MLLDVTNRNRVRQNLDRERDDFIALVSHELRTFITTIKASSQLGIRSSRKPDDERMIRLLNTINEQSDRMTRLIDDLLESSRIEGSSLSLLVAPVDLRELVNRVLDEQESTAPDFDITRALPEQEVPVNTDRQRIEQVLVNLVQNAIKYSGSSRSIEVAMHLEDGQVVSSVRDYGVGIPDDQQARIFERFFRARNADGQNSRGLGLGLYIADGIVSRLGGRMWLQSTEGEGSTFYFALPVVGQR